MNLTIVINAYKRPKSLQRLLNSISNADIPNDVKLVFSIEFNPDKKVVALINDFNFQGEKIIIRAESKRGLIGHYFFCGNLTQKYGAIIYLEDDLLVSPDFYKYSTAVYSAYKDEDNIAGFSLNALWFNGYSHFPFTPLDDGNPVYFLKSAWFQGQIYTQKQWSHFYEWYKKNDSFTYKTMRPEMKQLLQNDDWFPMKSKYLVENNKYYCFSRNSYTVNFGDAGTNFENSTNFFQTHLSLKWIDKEFIKFSDSDAVYDDFFELKIEKVKNLIPSLRGVDFELDLNALKEPQNYKTEYWLSPFKTDKVEKSYSLEMYPPENNLIYNIEGDSFFLCKREDLNISKHDRFKVLFKHFFYHNRYKLTRKEKLRFFLKQIFKTK